MEELQRQAQERVDQERMEIQQISSELIAKPKPTEEPCSSDEPPAKQIKLDNPEVVPDEPKVESDTPKIVPIENPPDSSDTVPVAEAPNNVPANDMVGYWQSRWKPKIIVKDGQYCRLETGYQTIFYGAEMALEEDGEFKTFVF